MEQNGVAKFTHGMPTAAVPCSTLWQGASLVGAIEPANLQLPFPTHFLGQHDP